MFQKLPVADCLAELHQAPEQLFVQSFVNSAMTTLILAEISAGHELNLLTLGGRLIVETGYLTATLVLVCHCFR